MRLIDLVLGFALTVLILAGLFLGIFFWQQSNLSLDTDTIANNQQTPGETALISAGRAQQAALNWKENAILVSASATWSPGVSITDLTSGRAEWTFVFYDSASSSAVNISVVNDKATIGKPYIVSEPIAPLALSGWKLNSDMAISLFLEKGGHQFLTNEQNVSVFMKLSTVTETQKIEWLMAAISDTSGNSYTMWLDATSGAILQEANIP